MMIAAFVALGSAVVLGSALAILHLRMEAPAAPPWLLAGLHGLLAIGGFACLLLGLRGPPRGLQTGMASFGTVAAVLIALAALLGGGILALRLLRARSSGTLIGIHATFAVSGFVFLAAYLFAG